jgi:hypothetical protein
MADRLPNTARGPFPRLWPDSVCGESPGHNCSDIDITRLAIWLVAKRVLDASAGVAFEVHCTPKDLEGDGRSRHRTNINFRIGPCCKSDSRATEKAIV